MKFTKKRVTNFFFILGVVAVVVMLFTFDVSFVELWGYIKRAGLWLVPILGIWIFIYALNAAAWRAIINSGHSDDQKVGFWYVYKLTVSGYALNYATPMGGLGGEPYRVVELSKRIGNQRATSSVILYVMTHFMAHFLFWFVSVFVYVALALRGDVPFSTPIKILLTITFLVSLAAIYLFSLGYKNGMVVKLVGSIGRLPGLKRWSARFLSKHSDALVRIDSQIADMHRQDKHTFYGTLAIEFLARIVQAAEIFFMLLLFGIGTGCGVSGIAITYIHSIMIVAITTLLANIIGFLPMQIGVQEGGFVVSIALLGIEPAFGIFVCIICRVREIFWIAVGLVLMKINGGTIRRTNKSDELPCN